MRGTLHHGPCDADRVLESLHEGHRTRTPFVVLDACVQGDMAIPVGPAAQTDAAIGEIALHHTHALLYGIKHGAPLLQHPPSSFIGRHAMIPSAQDERRPCRRLHEGLPGFSLG